jgi:hypothetical protein
MLVSRAGLDGFRAGFVLIAIAAAVGAVTTAIAFDRPVRPADESAPLTEAPTISRGDQNAAA